MAKVSLADRIKKQPGNKVPPEGHPPSATAQPQPGQPPQSGMAKTGSPAPTTGKKPPMPKAAPAAAQPGVNSKMNSAPTKPGRPGKANLVKAEQDILEVLEKAGERFTSKAPRYSLQENRGTVEGGKKQKTSGGGKSPFVASGSTTTPKPSKSLPRKSVQPNVVVNAPKVEAPQPSKRQTAVQHTSSEARETPIPDIGVKQKYQSPAHLHIAHYLANLANPGSPIISKVIGAAKNATMRPMTKSENPDIVETRNVKKPSSGTKVLPKPVDSDAPTKTKIKPATKNKTPSQSTSLEDEYQQRKLAEQDPAKKAKGEKIFTETRASLAHRNLKSHDPQTAAFGRHQWKEIPAKERIHHHIKGIVSKVVRAKKKFMPPKSA